MLIPSFFPITSSHNYCILIRNFTALEENAKPTHHSSNTNMSARRTLATASHLFLVVTLLVAALSGCASFVISPQRTQHPITNGGITRLQKHQQHQSYHTTTRRVNPILTTSLQATSNDFQDNLKTLGKSAANITARVGKAAGKAALMGLGQGIKGIKHVIQETKDNQQVQNGVKRLKTMVGNAKQDEQVQQGLNRIQNLVQEAQEKFQDTLNNNNNNKSNGNSYVSFDTADEELFRNIPKKRPEVIVNPEILEGVRVVGGRQSNVIDAEIITKTWSRD